MSFTNDQTSDEQALTLALPSLSVEQEAIKMVDVLWEMRNRVLFVCPPSGRKASNSFRCGEFQRLRSSLLELTIAAGSTLHDSGFSPHIDSFLYEKLFLFTEKWGSRTVNGDTNDDLSTDLSNVSSAADSFLLELDRFYISISNRLPESQAKTIWKLFCSFTKICEISSDDLSSLMGPLQGCFYEISDLLYTEGPFLGIEEGSLGDQLLSFVNNSSSLFSEYNNYLKGSVEQSLLASKETSQVDDSLLVKTKETSQVDDSLLAKTKLLYERIPALKDSLLQIYTIYHRGD